MTTRYIGARYVPTWYHNSLDDSSNWEVNVEYEPLTFVTSQNNHLYLSKKTVPDNIGTPAQNPSYWLDMGVITAPSQEIQDQIDAIVANMGDLNDLTTTDTSSLVAAINEINQGGPQNVKRYLVISDSYGMGRGGSTPWTTYLNNFLVPGAGNYFTFSEGSMGFNRAGESGHTTQQLLELHENDVTSHDTITDVIIGMGLNDTLALTGLASAMNDCINYIKATYPNAKISIGFIGNQTSKNTSGFVDYIKTIQAYQEACGRNNIAYISGVENVMHDCRLFISDGIHPTSDGGIYIAEFVATFLAGGSSVWHVYNDATVAGTAIPASIMKVSINNDVVSLTPVLENSTASLTFTQNSAAIIASIGNSPVTGIAGYVHYAPCFLYDGTKYVEAMWYVFNGYLYILSPHTITMPSGSKINFMSATYPTLEA